MRGYWDESTAAPEILLGLSRYKDKHTHTHLHKRHLRHLSVHSAIHCQHTHKHNSLLLSAVHELTFIKRQLKDDACAHTHTASWVQRVGFAQSKRDATSLPNKGGEGGQQGVTQTKTQTFKDTTTQTTKGHATSELKLSVCDLSEEALPVSQALQFIKAI